MIARDQEERYNGWTNRETWVCHLWLSNDQGLYDWATEVSRQLGPDGLCRGVEALQAAVIDPYGSVAYVEELSLAVPVRDTLLMLFDIGSLWRVSYDEVARAFLEE